MEHQFDLAVSAPATLAQITTEPYLRAFAEEVGVTVTGMACDEAAGRASMDWSFSTRAPGIPALARSLLPERVALRWEQSWSPVSADRADGTLSVAILGRPSATCTGTSLLTGDAGSCRLTTTTRTRASLPRPLAGRVESMIDKDLVGWILAVQARVLVRREAA